MDSTFNSQNQTWKINHIIETTGIVRDLGWSHIANVSRPKGTKQYYANLLIIDGQIVHSMVVA